ncbi:hypothetical protein D3C71_1674110 [compost metagenome]
MTQHSLGIGCRRQDQLGIAQIEQALLAVTLEHILGQCQITPPGRDRRFQLAALLPGQVTHRDTGQMSQTLDHQRMSRDTATKALPGIAVGRRIDNGPATLAPALKSVEHQALAVSSMTCGRRQNASRTARSEKRSRKRSSIISAHIRRSR